MTEHEALAYLKAIFAESRTQPPMLATKTILDGLRFLYDTIKRANEQIDS